MRENLTYGIDAEGAGNGSRDTAPDLYPTHKGAAGKALEYAHHTASPGGKRRQEEGLRGPVQRRWACKTLYEIGCKARHPWREYDRERLWSILY